MILRRFVELLSPRMQPDQRRTQLNALLIILLGILAVDGAAAVAILFLNQR